MTDYDATRAMDDTSATQALPRTQYGGPAPTRVHDVAPPMVAPAGRSPRDERAERSAARRAARRRRFGGFLALLAAIAAIVVVALALLSSSGDNGVQPVDTGDPQQQIDKLRDFLNEHSR
jgi:ferric-dicitrate binding protein FerR (iron transport regulator)